MKMHFIYFSIAALIALAIASPALEDRVSLSDDSVIARGLASAAANERRRVDELYDAYGDGDGSSSMTFTDRFEVYRPRIPKTSASLTGFTMMNIGGMTISETSTPGYRKIQPNVETFSPWVQKTNAN